MSSIARELRLFALLLLPAMVLGACSSDGPSDPNDDSDLEIVDSVSVELPVDSGEVGLVIDVREIARKGYVASDAEVSFPAYSSFDQTLEIDPVTSLAVLHLPIEGLSEPERTAFTSGVAMDISVFDDAHTLLAEHHEASQVMDDSNVPLSLQTTLPYIKRPLELKEGVPYLLQPEGRNGVLASFASDAYEVAGYAPASPVQQFYFTPVPGSPDADTYRVQHIAGYGEGTFWYLQEVDGWLNLGGDAVDLPPSGPQEFVFEQDDDGWLKIRFAGTSSYLVAPEAGAPELVPSAVDASRFRLITDNINWIVADRGTVFHDPIVPPAQLDFAYEATIRNCSEATLTETVGRAESRTTSSTTATTESLQLFSSDELGVGLTVGVEVGASVQGVGEVKGTVEASTNYTFTTSQTTTTENSLSETTEETSEVSRTRELQLPPFSAVEVYDAVRTIRNVRIPFSQVLRITATYDEGGAALSGPEIATQMLFNFVSGVPSDIGATYVDVSLRGHMVVDQLFEAETDANDIPGGCT